MAEIIVETIVHDQDPHHAMVFVETQEVIPEVIPEVGQEVDLEVGQEVGQEVVRHKEVDNVTIGSVEK